MGKEEVKRKKALQAWKKRWGFKERDGFEERNGFFDDANASQGERSPQTAEIDKKSLKEDKARLDKVFQARNESGEQPIKPKKRKAKDDSDLDIDYFKEKTQATEGVAKKPDVFAEEAATTADADKYDPLEAPFARAVLRRRRVRLVLDATATQDQLTQTAYTASRRKELEKIAPNHYLTEEYGLRTIRSQVPFDEQSGMRIANPQSSVYLRDNPGDAVKELFAKAYNKTAQKQGGGVFDPEKMVVVNSAKTMEKLEAFYGAEWADLKTKCKGTEKIAEGIHVITFQDKLTSDEQQQLRLWIQGTGSMPSSYDAIRSLSDDQTDSLNKPASQEPLGNKETLTKLVDSSGCKALQKVPDKHPMKNVATAVANLVGGLKDALEQTLAERGEDFEKSPLVESALKNLDNLMEAMPTYLEDTPRFTKLFDVLIDEVYLLLATCKPYKEKDYKDQAKKVLFDRAPALKEMVKQATPVEGGESKIGVEAYAMSSGMGAISNAIQAAVACSGVKSTDVDVADEKSKPMGVESANYWELQFYLLKKEQHVNDKGKVLVATLNPSTPTTERGGGKTDEAWGIAQLNDKIQKKIEMLGGDLTPESPLTVVVDVTIEKSAEKSADNELNQLFSKFDKQIGAGLVTFVLCKSYQKYPSLGAGKVMAGGVSLVGKRKEKEEQPDGNFEKLTKQLKEAEDETALMKKDEGQLMTHLLANGGDVEQPMLQRAAKNAKFLADKLITPTGDKYLYSDDLPFAVISSRDWDPSVPKKEDQAKSDSMLQFASGGQNHKVDATSLMLKVGLDSRDSFAFQNSSFLGINDGMMRLNPGQEPESEIVEKFFAVGKLIASNAPIALDDVTNLAHKAADVAFADVEKIMALPEEPKNDKEEAQNKPKAKDPRAVWQEHRTQAVREMFQGIGTTALENVDTEAARAVLRLTIVDKARGLANKEKDAQKAEQYRNIAAKYEEEVDDLLAGGWEKIEQGRLFPDQRFAAKVKLVSLAATPKLDDTSRAVPKLEDQPQAAEDPNLMKAGLDWGWKGSEQSSEKVETNYLQNIVASCARFGAAVFEAPEDRDKVAGMIEALTASPGGLSRVSPEMKEVLLTQQTRQLLEKRPLPTEEKARKAHLAKMQKCLKELPYTDGAANLFARELPADLYAGVEVNETPEMQELSDSFLQEIPLESKMDLLARLVDQSKQRAESAQKQNEWVLKFEKYAAEAEEEADICREEAELENSLADKYIALIPKDEARYEKLASDELQKAEQSTKKEKELREKAVLQRERGAASKKRFEEQKKPALDFKVRAWACVHHLQRMFKAAESGELPAARESLSAQDLHGTAAQEKGKQLTQDKLKVVKEEFARHLDVLSKVNI
jgi:hypothetical protein